MLGRALTGAPRRCAGLVGGAPSGDAAAEPVDGVKKPPMAGFGLPNGSASKNFSSCLVIDFARASASHSRSDGAILQVGLEHRTNARYDQIGHVHQHLMAAR